MKFFGYILLILSGIVIGFLLYMVLFGRGSKINPMPDSKQQILLERIKNVAKLVTVEGEFANVHEYKNFYWTDISIFNKKALLKVKAKVSVGFDLKKMVWNVDSINKTIRISNMPQPEIISIDHDVSYYDMQEGMFNSFSESDLTEINQVIKKKLQESTEKGPLMEKARQEGFDQLEIIKILVEQAGWTFVISSGDFQSGDSTNNSKIPVIKKKDKPLLY